jgi:competence protein ComEC
LILSFILLVTKYSGEFEYSIFHIATPSIFLLLIYCLVIVLWYFYPEILVHHRKKLLILILIYSIFVISKPILFPKLNIYYLDVGQGDATFISTPKGINILVDGGGVVGGGISDKGETVVLPFLYHKGINHIDLVISTHPDSDHLAGLISVVNNLNIGKVVVPYQSQKYKILDGVIQKGKIEKDFAMEKEVINIDDNTKIEFFNPQYDGTTYNDENVSDEDSNKYSIGFRLTYQKTSYLFCGDIPKEVEKNAILRNNNLTADILKVSHHGAKTSTSQEFVDNVRPKLAIISVGKNRYGHPSYDTIERLESFGAKILRTDNDGAIIITSDGYKNIIKTMIER